MGDGIKKLIRNILQVALVVSSIGIFAQTGNIDTVDKYAWSENSGWFNFKPTFGGVSVLDDHLKGYVWGSGIGWIKLGADGHGPYDPAQIAGNWGVNRDINTGILSGYGWSETAGWINFATEYSDVIIDEVTGSFDGYAWSSGVGWVHFKGTDPAYNVKAGFLSLLLLPGSSIAQGYNEQVLEAVIENGFANIELQWSAPGYVFSLDENPITVPIPAPGSSIDFSVTVNDQLSRATSSATVRLLVASDISYFDYADPVDCNTLEDLWTLCSEWRFDYPSFNDPNADGFFNVIDFLYINVEDEGQPCED